MRFVYFPGLPLAFLLALPPVTQAAQWSVEPTVSLRSGYNDNIRLTTAGHDSVWEEDVTPAVKFGVSKENQGLFGNADASIRRFYGGSGDNSSDLLDREDYHFKVNSYHNTERNNFGANINITRDSTLDSELTETGQIIPNRATRMSTVLNPSWARLLNEKTRLEFNYQFNRVKYSDEVGQSNLVNYDFNTISTSLLRQFTPLTQGAVALSFNRYLPETNLNSDTYALQVGLDRKHSETLSTSWLAGWRETRSDTLNPTGFCTFANPGTSFPQCTGGIPVQTGTDKDESSNSGAVYAASITKTLERGSLGASLSRSATPSGDGQLLDTTRLTLTGEHRFTETLRSDLMVEYYKRDTIVNAAGEPATDNRNFFRVRPRVTWQWQREWLLSANYEYAASDETNGGTARRNALYLTLNYRPTKLFISR
jgi:hypothetical protein